MKQRFLLIFTLLFVSMGIFSQNIRPNYESNWDKVEEYKNNSLPKSAIQEVDKVLKMALKDKNTPQLLKAYIYMKELNEQIDTDSGYDMIAKLEELVSKTANAEEQALLHAVLANLYADSYKADSWNIDRRTKLSREVPADIKEWTSNIYVDKIYNHLNASLQNKVLLKKAETKSYDDIIYLGKDSRTYYPTLYDFVMKQALEIAKSLPELGNEEFDIALLDVSINDLLLPAKKYTVLKLGAPQNYTVFSYYQQYLSDLQDRGMTNTIILTELDKYNFVVSKSYALNNTDKLKVLMGYEEVYAKNETCVEIIDAIVSELEYNPYSSISFRSRKAIGTANIENENNAEIYRWLKKGIQEYANCSRVNVLKSKLQSLEFPDITVIGNPLWYGGDNIIFDLIHKNSQIVKTDKRLEFYRVVGGKEILEKDFPLNYVSKETYIADSAKVELGKLPFGKYILRAKTETTDKDKIKSDGYEFIVSDLMSYSRNSAKDEYEIFVVNRRNGKAVSGAKVTVYEAKYNERVEPNKILATLTTNEQGLAVYKDVSADNNRYPVAIYSVSLGEDKFLSDQRLNSDSYNYSRGYEPDEEILAKNAVSIFVDRSIYRPGQMVQMKAIVADKNSKVVANKKQVVKLYNPNGDVVTEKTLFTNDFGSIAAGFVLPQGGMLGQYRIEINSADNLYFSVEEYKRPTFEVTFDKVENTYSLGEKVTLKGNAKTFSGISLQGADVKYTITRRPFSFWFWNRSNESHYADGVVKTKDDGSFAIEFVPESGDSPQIFGRNMYTFTITADITDVNGETQSNNYTLSVGEQSMILDVQIPDGKIEKTADIAIKIAAKNLEGIDIETSGTYDVYTLDKNDSIETKVLVGTFKTGIQKELLAKLKKLTSGKYQIQVAGKDSNGQVVKSSTNFVLYSFLDKKPPYETDTWMVVKEGAFSSQKSAEVIWGTSNKDVYVLYQVYNNEAVFERKFVKFDNQNRLFKLPYKAEYGDEVYMSFISIKDGNLESQNIFIKKEEDKKDETLKIKLDVFRDKLRPGQEETWTMSISDGKDQIVSAEILASMYDISLDQIRPFTAWVLNKPYLYKKYLSPFYYNYYRAYKGAYSLDLNYKPNLEEVPSFDFDRWKFSVQYSENIFYKESTVKHYTGTVTMTRAIEPAMALQGKADQSLNFVPSLRIHEMADGAGEAIPNTMPSEQTQVRRNFNETAFFFPQLRTNDKGQTVVSFSVPESNTTWRFRTFAHSKDSKMGELEKMIVTRKELMVTPNMPRFVRQGDKTSISTKISNLSENTLEGTVRLEFFNPISDKVVDLGIKDMSQSFEMKKDASASATWTFDVPTTIDMLGVRIVANSESFSDGEQHVLAVLPNRMLVTETMPVDVVGKGEQVYTLDKLANNKSNTLDHYKLTFEFASNPAWYAVQALPTLANPTNEDAISWFASYYVNRFGASLMAQYPKVANTIEAWTKKGENNKTLVSKLLMNEELKTILLEETPWVLDGKSETEQMENLAMLLDLNNTRYKTGLALDKLNELQVSEGGWSWYKGMNANRSITQYILYGFANLQRVGMVEYNDQVKMMQINALKFIDEKIVEDYNNLKKYNKDWKSITSIATSQLEYLYVRAMYRDIPISQEAREAERFYTDIVSKNWTKASLYEKSLLAVILPQMGEKALAKKVATSIKEHAVTKKELGMYWPNNKANVFLSLSAVSTHTFMMEAMKANGATVEEMDMMKRWLVKQKQTQIWESSHATIDAIGALLQDGSNWYESDITPSIKVGKQEVKIENRELGTGYFKTSWSKSEIKADMAKVTINSDDNKPAYGSLYWQYYEDLDKVTKQDGSLNISKELYKSVVDQSGQSLVKVTDANPLAVGDKVVVRLVVRVDRDMKFVQLKDMRASCFEPVNTISGMSWQNSVPYYQTTKDASTNFFFDMLPKGTYVFEYSVYVNRIGEYSNGITSIQSTYAPEFTSHTAGVKVVVK